MGGGDAPSPPPYFVFLPIVPMGRGTANFGGGGVEGRSLANCPSTPLHGVPLPKCDLGRKSAPRKLLHIVHVGAADPLLGAVAEPGGPVAGLVAVQADDRIAPEDHRAVDAH